MTSRIEGRVLRRGDYRYESLRREACWHAGVPDRYPEVIVLANHEDDVVGAVRLARREGLRIAVRSGGHSWSASHLRDGTVLIDLSNLRHVTVDREAMTGTAQPGIKGSEFSSMLAGQNLFFPTGHCSGVSLGGYLLQGGFAWAGRDYGPACMSVTGIDAVTAAGEQVHADETENPDLFWASRGAGPGFFAVVTRFHVKLHPRRRITMNSGYFWPASAAYDVYRFVHETGRRTPTEINLLCSRDPMTDDEPLIALNATAFTDTEEEAREQLSVYESCPARAQALATRLNEVTDTATLSRFGTDPHYDETKRYLADNMWTHASFDDLWPNFEEMLKTWPPAPSHLVMFNWGGHEGQPARPSMAYSVEDELYYALYAAWTDPADDSTYTRWVTDHMRAWEPYASGIQLADENLLNRPYRFVTDENLRRLDDLRATWDPGGMFVSWLGRPAGGGPG
ncbi:FAD-binding oxidoreductase [Streptomyces sp. NRRL S-1813]|uniref:FAD-binding oxidoreductase n=1 Tax=Streptomyces sp. NRRL S-1813 TaxID=1463888 RepID=UPI0004C4ED1D|nr:FAD-binding oxidoreductase [Streptomyces sp. NRRL S-1813]